jgi:hypothetical protein
LVLIGKKSGQFLGQIGMACQQGGAVWRGAGFDRFQVLDEYLVQPALAVDGEGRVVGHASFSRVQVFA